MAMQQILQEPTTYSLSFDIRPDHNPFCCHRIWDSSQARFTQCFLPFISAIPAAIALGIVFHHVFRLSVFHFHLRRPIWTKRFVQEIVERKEDPDLKATDYSSRFALALCITSVIGIVMQVVGIVYGRISGFQAACGSISWAITCLVVAVTRPRTAPISLFTLYATITVTQLIVLIDIGSAPSIEDIPALFGLMAALIATFTVLFMPLRDPTLIADRISPSFSPPTAGLRSPEDNLSLLQFLTVSWMSPLISVGASRRLDDNDVWNLGYEFQHKVLHDTFRGLQGSVLKRLLVANGIDLVLIALLGLVELLSNSSTPILLQQLLRSMDDSEAHRSAAITYAVLTLAVRLIASQASVLNLWFSRRAYERSRGELITMLSEKTLSRKMMNVNQPAEKDKQKATNGSATPQDDQDSDDSDESASTGKILNLIRFDAYEVAQRFWEFESLVTEPLGVIISVILIWRLIGWSCLIGVVTIFVAQGVNALIARVLLRWEKLRRAATDKKLQQISQFVEAIRHLRWYGWQDVWLGHIMEARQRELTLRVITRLWNMLIGFINEFASGMFPVVAFYAYTVLAGKPLSIDVAFPAMQLFSMLETNLRDVPGLIIILLNASVALGRIESFMQEPDKEGTKASSDAVVSLSARANLELRQATFAWPGVDKAVLHDVSISLPTGLTLVCGEVAAGKSAFLQALLGELDQRGGEYTRPSEIFGYCAQTPWLQSMSIRENILFSTPYEESRYKQVLEACALTSDMAVFKHGDLSNIGENGIGLSGGQKARLALARAVYSQARILLLDDPLSALDQQTAETIVRKLFSDGNLLNDRTTVLVTHRTELCLGMAKQMIEIANGRVHILDAHSTMNASWRTVSPEAKVASQQTRDKDTNSDTAPDSAHEEEYRAHGGVRFQVYWEYIKAGKLKWWVLLVISLALFRLVNVAETWFLKSWGEAYGTPSVGGGYFPPFLMSSSTSFEAPPAFPKAIVSDPFTNLPSPEKNIRPWLIGFFLLATAKSLMFLFSQGIMSVIIYTAGRGMFAEVMERVGHATFRFYDVTPVGRLMNRLTGDAGTIDGNISQLFQIMTRLMISWVSSIVIIMSVTPVFLLFAVALTTGFVFIFLRFLPTSQSLRRLEMVSLSPLMSNFGAVLSGLVTIRAFRAEDHFQSRVIAVTDTFQKHDHFYWSLQAWLSYRFDALSASSTLILTLLALYTGVSPGLTAFVLIAASKFVNSTHALCRFYGQLQMDFVSVERVVELLHLEQEPPGAVTPPAWWPTMNGDIVFEDVTLRYAPHLDPSLENISLKIKAGSSTALLGRTGSGKSTLALALLATVLPESGRILIENVDIATVNTQALRRRVTFLAQEPVLFPGSMRQNLDPLDEFADEACESVLEKIAARHQWTLDTQIETGGRNLSQGQRQLVGLARALLRRSPIVIFDEATASIDTKTSVQIQQILREEMKESTVITIAHRLEAVKDADYRIVLGKGRVLEAGAA